MAKGQLSAEPEELQAALAIRVRHTPKKVGYQKATLVVILICLQVMRNYLNVNLRIFSVI